MKQVVMALAIILLGTMCYAQDTIKTTLTTGVTVAFGDGFRGVGAEVGMLFPVAQTYKVGFGLGMRGLSMAGAAKEEFDAVVNEALDMGIRVKLNAYTLFFGPSFIHAKTGVGFSAGLAISKAIVTAYEIGYRSNEVKEPITELAPYIHLQWIPSFLGKERFPIYLKAGAEFYQGQVDGNIGVGLNFNLK